MPSPTQRGAANKAWVLCSFVALAWLFAGQVLAIDTVDFQRDVQPILAEHCTRCHGVDPSDRQASLRLDRREDALRGGDSEKPAIAPGEPQRSELIARVTSHDPDVVMPPAADHNPLSAHQIQLLTRWVEQGAPYAGHWAFLPPRQVPLSPSGPAHPVDNLVADQLRATGLRPAPPAAESTLCRRLCLDVVGLPPTPQELAAFSRDGFDAKFDALLASERFGEKWARHWLDAARYSDTNGYEKDLRREQWAWRDWVIDALNRDMPYDRFLIEQIAGDLLPQPTQSQIVATGFLRNSMINEEGAIVPEQFRMFEMFDRLDCIGKSVLGLTTQCAQCHTHKYDPLTQEEYYGMFAFLNNSFEARSPVFTEEQQRTIDELLAQIQRLEDRLRQEHPQWQEEMQSWAEDVVQKQTTWTPLETTLLETISGLNHPVQLPDQSILMLGHASSDVFLVAQPDSNRVTGIRFEALPHGDLPYRGPGRGQTGAWDVRGIEVFVKKPAGEKWEKLPLAAATADFSSPEQKTKDEKKAHGPARFLIDGSDDTAWRSDRGIGRRNQPSAAAVQFAQPLDMPPGTQLKIAWRMNTMVGCCRISITSDPDPAILPVNHAAILALGTPRTERTAAQQAAIFTAWRQSRADCQAFNDEIAAAWERYPPARTTVLHLAERDDGFQRTTYLLDRGEWDRPQRDVAPHTPAFLHPLDEHASRDRLAFARWLASDRSPLTARVAVNRVWQAIFGAGLVETPEDFGTRAPVPVHRDLLDWLAVDFMEHGWSHKHLIRMIVSSSTYGQSSHVTPEGLERDPLNRLFARGPRFRCDAEVVRDIALSASGLIHHELGGPPIIPPVPQNVLDYNFVYPDYWKSTEGPDRYRRSLYGFRKRSMPDPVMASFDGPNGDAACVRRVLSNTPLAALTALNETVFVEAAQALALRLLRDGGGTDSQRVDFAFLLCTARTPNPAERGEVLALLNSQRQRLADGWLNPREVATGDPAKLPQLPPPATPQDAAAWTIVARVLLNLDETISKN